MKPIYSIILALLLLPLVACSDNALEPAMPDWHAGEVPIALRAIAPPKSRADIESLDGEIYDVYTCSIYHSAPGAGYYTAYDGKEMFRQMAYDADNSLFYLARFFFPMKGYMDLLTYGVETGKSINAYPLPLTLVNRYSTADCMVLDLTKGYDGTYDVIAAERLTIQCKPDMNAASLPYGHFHHILSHIDFKFEWGSGVTAGSPIIDRVFINSVKIKNTTYKGQFYVDYLSTNTPPYNLPNVADGHWEDLSDDMPEITKDAMPQSIPFGSRLNFGGIYIIPQANRQKIIVNYTLVNGSTGEEVAKTMNYVVEDPLADIPKGWLAGHKYTYVISIGVTGNISINNVEVASFREGDVGNTEIY